MSSVEIKSTSNTTPVMAVESAEDSHNETCIQSLPEIAAALPQLNSPEVTQPDEKSHLLGNEYESWSSSGSESESDTEVEQMKRPSLPSSYNTWDWKLKCERCLREDISHECRENVLMVQQSRLSSWVQIRERPNPNHYQYKLCKYTAVKACWGGSDCKFAHNKEEQELWKLEEGSQFTVRDFINSNHSQDASHQSRQIAKAPTEQPQAGPKIDKECPYKIECWCGICWRSNGLESHKSKENYCQQNHSQWNSNKLYMILPARKVLNPLPNVSRGRRPKPRPTSLVGGYGTGFPRARKLHRIAGGGGGGGGGGAGGKKDHKDQPDPSSKKKTYGLRLCDHIINGRKCKNYQNQRCHFAHSEEELKVWIWMKQNHIKHLHEITPGESLPPGAPAVLNNASSGQTPTWKYRGPVWRNTYSPHQMCAQHANNHSCHYSNVEDAGNRCAHAHSQVELDEGISDVDSYTA